MGLTQALKVGGGIAILLALLALFALIGAISMGTTAIIIGGGLYLLGFVSMGTAQAIVIGIAGVGAVLGVLGGVLNLLVLG